VESRFPSSEQFSMGGVCCNGLQGLQDPQEVPCGLEDSTGPRDLLPKGSTVSTEVVDDLDHVLPVHEGPSKGLTPQPKRRSIRPRGLHSMAYETDAHMLKEFTDPSDDVAFEAFKKVWFAEFGDDSTEATGESSGTSVCNSSRLSDASPSSASDCMLMSPPKPPPSFFVMADGRPNFSGTWLCHAIHGDIDALMVSMQVDWARRTAASCFGYGVNVSTRTIEQHGNQLVIHACMLPGVSFVQSFEIGGGEQQTLGPEGAVKLLPKWEHGGVLSVAQSELDGSLPSIWQQFFNGEDLVVKIIAPSGVSGCWQYGRVDE